jgi:amidase
MSVTEDVPLDILTELNGARMKLTSGDAWQFYKRLADKWGTKNFSPSVKERMGTLTPISTADYVAAWEAQDVCKSRMLAWMTKYDVFLGPGAAKPAQPIDADPSTPGFGAPGTGWQYTGVFNSTGWPVTVVRCGSSADGKLPIGVQVVAAPWREDITLAVASFLEGKSGGWKAPPI